MERARRTLGVVLTALLPLAAPAPASAQEVDLTAVGARGVNGAGAVDGGGVVLRRPLGRAPGLLQAGADRLHGRLTVLDLDDREGDGVALASLGVEWQWRADPLGLDSELRVGTGPSVLSDDRLDGEALGGRFHFTSHVALAVDPSGTGRWRLSLGVYHVSNAGIRETNPGFEVQTLAVRTRIRF